MALACDVGLIFPTTRSKKKRRERASPAHTSPNAYFFQVQPVGGRKEGRKGKRKKEEGEGPRRGLARQFGLDIGRCPAKNKLQNEPLAIIILRF